MSHWLDYKTKHHTHTVAGRLLVCEQIHSPQLQNNRDILVWLPISYDTQPEKRYPVLYMQDGQNLFDAYTSYAGEWAVDETMLRLADEGYEAIIVGIPNNDRRMFEYSPYADKWLRMNEGQGNAYLAFLTETLKTLIDKDFRTLPDRYHTGIAGSSMGGLISLYAYFKCPHIYGFCGALSPSHWVGNSAIFQTIEHTSFFPGKIYLDIGGQEGNPATRRHKTGSLENPYLLAVRRLSEVLIKKGFAPGYHLRYVEDLLGKHNEEAWARRLPDALRFLIPRD